MTSLIIRQTVHIEQSTRSHRNWQAVYIDTGHSFTSRNVPCRRGKMHSLQGRGQKRKSLDFSRLFRVGGRNRTRTCDPIDVNDVLCLGGKVCRKQMLGVHMPKNVDITGFSHFLPHPSGVRRMGVHRVFTPF